MKYVVEVLVGKKINQLVYNLCCPSWPSVLAGSDWSCVSGFRSSACTLTAAAVRIRKEEEGTGPKRFDSTQPDWRELTVSLAGQEWENWF